MIFKSKSKQQLKINHLVLLLVTATLCLFAYPFLSNSTVEAVSPIERCERNDIENTRKCKREYRKCNNKHPNNSQKRDQCKEKAINDNKKSGGGGSNPTRRNPGGSTQPAGLGEAGEYICGTFINEDRNVKTRFDFGCTGTAFAKLGEGQKNSSNIKNISPILDLTYAFIRFLSVGVGIVLAISVIISGIQYSMSEGNAEITQKAKARIRSAILGLGIYIFAFSMLQFLIPGGVFKPGLWVDDSILQYLIRLGL